jgi:hypothetical protein
MAKSCEGRDVLGRFGYYFVYLVYNSAWYVVGDQ